MRERWGMPDDGKIFGPVGPPPYREWEALGAEMVLSEGPHKLGPGCWMTGTVPRLSFENAGLPKSLSYRQGSEFHKDMLEDDQAIIIHMTGKGLAIVSGCAHSGILNTVNYACQISGVNQIYAVIGGFHMARSSAEDNQNTIDTFQSYHPAIVATSHCAGLQAMPVCRPDAGRICTGGIGRQLSILGYFA